MSHLIYPFKVQKKSGQNKISLVLSRLILTVDRGFFNASPVIGRAVVPNILKQFYSAAFVSSSIVLFAAAALAPEVTFLNAAIA